MSNDEDQPESSSGEPGDTEAASSQTGSTPAEAGASAGTDVATATRPDATIDVAAAEAARRKAQLRDRLVLPVLLPFLSIFVVVLVALNISRIFLAGPDHRAVIVATVITVGILGGAALLSSGRHVRSSSLVLGLSLGFILILSAGLVTFGAGEVDEEFGPQAPTSEAVNTFEVDASNFQFQSGEFTLPPGITEIDYVLIEGSHTLVFSEPEFSYLELEVPGTPQKGKVEFEAGKTYTMFCTVPGHREAGMEATVTITDAVADGDAETSTSTTTTAP